MAFVHIPVLPREAVTWLNVQPDGLYIDGTLGGGGHTELILRAGGRCQVLGIDRDGDAVKAAGERLASFGARAHLFRGCFSDMDAFAGELGWERVDGILLDVGISSHQLDTPVRGFSFRSDGPLDMRMDRRARTTAATLLNTAGEEELRRIFREYGEEPRAGAVARAVVRRREEKPFSRTAEFAELCEAVAEKRQGRKLPPATRCFQALRIAVNEELEELRAVLDRAIALLKPGGRLVVISFHSLEDRIVKHAFRDAAATCVCPPGMPVCRCGKTATLNVLTRKPVFAADDELAANPRAGSARLRAAEKICRGQ